MKSGSRIGLSLLSVALLSMLMFSLLFLTMPERAHAAVYLVTLTSDTLPAGVPGELRWAINSANATPGVPDTINFAIPAPPYSILPLTTPLPAITDTVFIDGYSQIGSVPPGGPGVPATILIELDGTLAGPADGLVFQGPAASGSQVRGLAVNRFLLNGIFIQGANGVIVDGNNIGTDVLGAIPLPNGIHGVYVSGGSTGNMIGGTLPFFYRNVISGNLTDGVNIDNSPGNFVYGNYIGTDMIGGIPLPNGNNGVTVTNGSAANAVGGINPGEGNVISGNAAHGVYVNASSGNTLEGNYIGTDMTGTVPLGNSSDGVNISGGSSGNTVGGTTALHRNVISGNGVEGVQVDASTGNTVSANYIGTDVTGGAAMGNGGTGVAITNGATGNTVGGTTAAAECNVISDNFYGLHIQNSTGNFAYGNYVGTDAGGTLDLGNQNRGIYVESANNNTIGGATALHRNLVSGNDAEGINVRGSSGVTVQGNYVGTDAGGTLDLGNTWMGIWLLDNTGVNTIGGSWAAGTGNLVSGNDRFGIRVQNSPGQVVQGNYIGTDVSGTLDLGNTWEGMFVESGSNGCSIGGSGAGQGNLVSGNDGDGIEIYTSTGNLVYGNRIGTDVTGTGPLGNSNYGIYMQNGANSNLIGGAAAGQGNLLSGNAWEGVYIDGSTGNAVQGNHIGTDVTGMGPLGNGSGVSVVNVSSGNTIGGSNPGEGNVISGNGSAGVGGYGVYVNNSTGNFVYGNYIGTDSAGAGPLPNGMYGVSLVSSANSNTIGGATPGHRNVISGNSTFGISASNFSTGNMIYGNYIGTDAAGTSPLPNGNHGITIASNSNTIGGSNPGEGNLISGNANCGIAVSGSTGTIIQGNYVGTDATGAVALPNNQDGVNISSASLSNTVGGSNPGEGNLISGNTGNGVSTGLGSTGNSIQGNRIGTDAAGSSPVPNGANGVYLSSSSNTVGGSNPGEGNVISGNTSDGVEIDAGGNYVYGNRIGTDAAGTSPVPNGANGVYLPSGGNYNAVGGSNPGEGNVISGNGQEGINIDASTNNAISGNYVGMDATGGTALGNGGAGMYLRNGADDNTIGGNTASHRNVISGNGGNGILSNGCNGNVIQGNYIGTDLNGAADRGNADQGVSVGGGSGTTTVGGDRTAGLGNLISGNDNGGIYFDNTGTVIMGNYIGTDATGSNSIPNATGITAASGASGDDIGGGGTGQGNLVSGNSANGIVITEGSSAISVQGNYVGTNAAGTGSLPNGANGVYLTGGATGNTVGGDSTAGEGNLISGNSHNGIRIEDATSNSVLGNHIGTTFGGSSGLGNGWSGVELFLHADNNTIGGNTAGHRNVISGNTASGVSINTSCAGNQVQGNHIGTDAAGTSPVANLTGVYLNNGANGNTIGGSNPGEGNLISGNTGNGLVIDGSTGNFVEGNHIGTDTTGGIGLGNGGTGVAFVNGADNNSVGGATAGHRNVISDNGADGIEVNGSTGCWVLGNYVGTDSSGTLDLGNAGAGVLLRNGANGNTVGGDGTAGQGNLISGNDGSGVEVDGLNNIVVRGNYIGTNAAGTGPLGNGVNGVRLLGGATGNYIGGGGTGESNLISGNDDDGVELDSSTNNFIQGNLIGTDWDGDADLGNGANGVYLFNGADFNLIGGSNPAQRNVISGNGVDGIRADGSANNAVQGCFIGTDCAGSTGGTAIANDGNGIYLLNGSNGSIIGGGNLGEGDLVSGNGVDGVRVDNSTGVSVQGCRIGTDLNGTLDLGNGGNGVYLLNGADYNLIGGSNPAQRNVISGNGVDGIRADGSANNAVQGNYIGTDVNGTSALANGGNGIYLNNSAAGNTIGGATAGHRNVISGNTADGVLVNASTNNAVQGNYIGIDAAGAYRQKNGGNGISLTGGSNTTIIGGASAGEGNLVSGNDLNGIIINSCTGCSIQGNLVGTNAAGTSPVGNWGSGVQLQNNSGSNIVGGATAGHRNVVSGNSGDGIVMQTGSTGNAVQGNYIGTNAAGTGALPNGVGVLINSTADNNTIGGTTAGLGNLISGNNSHGVYIVSATGSVLQGNYIGTDAAGTSAVANSDGVHLAAGANSSTIGGATAGHRNVVSGNSGDGIVLQNGSTGNAVQGNYIGTNAAGTGALPNGVGVLIFGTADNNTIGGTSAGQGNLISGNNSHGVYIGSATGSVLQGNYIGTDAAGSGALANGADGVHLAGGADSSTIGGATAGHRNVISGNAAEGVDIDGSTGCFIQGNYIGTDAAGTGSLANSNGIVVGNTLTGNTIGGAAAGEGNLISGNGFRGVYVYLSTGNTLRGNRIGTDAAGTAALANGTQGVYLNDADSTDIGGSGAGEANLVCYNGSDGVSITSNTTDCEVSYNTITDNTGIGVVVWDAGSIRNEVSRNSLYNNGGLAVDLLGDGVTPNDGNNDNPAKPNRGYNFPVFADVEVPLIGGTAYVSGTAPPNAHIEFYYVGAAQDPTGHGEGLTYVGTTDAGGTGDFTATLAGLSAGDYLSAIAISPAGDPSGQGNTSEFSLNAMVDNGYNVDASVTGGHGTVDPLNQKVADGRTATIDLAPDAHYHPATITDNGAPATVADPYVINNVTANHAVVVTFAIDAFDVDASVSGGGGSVDPATQSITYGSPASIDIEPDPNYHIATITDNGVPQAVSDPYQITSVTEAHAVVVTFAPDTRYFYFAEGYTGSGFQEYLCLGNTEAGPITVDVTYLFKDGSAPLDCSYDVPALSRATVDVNGVVGTGREVSIKCAAAGSFIAERPMYFDYGGWTGGHDTVGASAPSNTWYFAEGYTGDGFDEYICVLNDGNAAAELTFNFQTQEAGLIPKAGYSVGPHTRGTFKVNDILGPGYQTSLKLESSQPVVAERPMYFNYNGAWTGGHCVMGAPALGKTYYFAEGTTRTVFHEYLTLQNPGTSAIIVDALYQLGAGQGANVNEQYTVGAGERYTVFVADEVGEEKDVSVKLSSASDFLAERPMYFDYDRAWTGGHCVIGSGTQGARWFFAEGYTGSGFHEWLTIQNTGASEAHVQVNYYPESGTAFTRDHTVPPGTRYNIFVNTDAGEGLALSAEIVSDVPVIAERPMYFSFGPQGWTGGHDVVGYQP